MTIELTVDTDPLRRALRRAPGRLRDELRLALGRSALEIARAARRNAPKAHSILTNSISSYMSPDGLEAVVFAGADYARMVEERTGPGGKPPVQSMLDWIRVKRIVPDDPSMDQTDLAFVIARSIARKGTRAQPFMAPAFEDNKARAMDRINQAIGRALRG